MNDKEICIENLSLHQLINESVEMYKMLKLITNSDKEYWELLTNSIVPFIGFVCDGILSFLPEDLNLGELNIDKDYREFKSFVRKIRVGHKLYSDKHLKEIIKLLRKQQTLNQNILRSDYTDEQGLIAEIIGQDDYTVFKYHGNDYFTNYQGLIYFKHLLNKYKDPDLQTIINSINSELRELSKELALLLSYFVNLYQNELNKDEYELLINNQDIIEQSINAFSTMDMDLQDNYDLRKFNNRLPIESIILLHSNLCQLNFASIIIPTVLNNQSYIYIRFMMVTFLESIKNVKKLVDTEDLTPNELSVLNAILDSDVYKLLSSESVRNNIAHYKIKNFEIEQILDGSEGNSFLMNIIEHAADKDFSTIWKEFLVQMINLRELLMLVTFTNG